VAVAAAAIVLAPVDLVVVVLELVAEDLVHLELMVEAVVVVENEAQ
jgi:hypothetical protein